MLYSLDDLPRLFSPDILDEAGRILYRGKVASPSVSRNGEIITSLVKRNGQRDYRVYVRLERPVDASISIHGECSCSRPGNCEHVAAVLLSGLDNESNATVGDLGQSRPWRIDRVAKAGVDSSRVQQRLLYLLYANPRQDGPIMLETVCARLLKSGGFAGRKRYRPDSAARGRPPSFLQPVDLRLLAELGAVTTDPQTGMHCLHDAGSDDLLKGLLDTGRCLLGDSDLLLRRGQIRDLSLVWTVDEAGNQYSTLCAEPETPVVFLLGRRPWYIDPATGECGRLETDLPGGLLAELFAGIRVEPGSEERVEAGLAKRYPGVALPPLRRFEIEAYPALRPVPCLGFFSEATEDPWFETARMDFLRLTFDYAGVRLGGDQAAQVLVDGRVIRIRRDREFETRCAGRLVEAGLLLNGLWGDEPPGKCFVVDGDPERWLAFQADTLPRLRAAGWHIEFDESFAYRLAPIEGWYGEIRPQHDNAWFDTSLGVVVEGERINLLPPLVALIEDAPKLFRQDRLWERDPRQQLMVPLEDGRILPVPVDRVRIILSTLYELYGDSALDQYGQMRLSRIQLARLAELDDEDAALRVDWRGAEAQQALVERLRGVDHIPPVDPPEALHTRLRDYQRQGLSWLQFLREYELAGVLADDMGLGKTVQTLAHLLLEKAQGRMDRPSLVVAPTSLMVNWRREATRFAPGLRLLTLHGPKRSRYFNSLADYDLVLTSYPLLVRDQAVLLQQPYHLLILDEAQVIKNPKTRASRLVRQLEARHRLCLTGTPLENHLGELWSLFDFLLPGLLGSVKQFARVLRHPIEKQADEAAAQQLAQRVRPFMLRRTKQQVARDLPPKTEIVQGVELAGAQRDLYESIRLAMHAKVRRAVAEQGMERSHIIVLDALLKLRQVCCDPRLVKLESAGKVKQSAKLALLMDLLPEMIEEGRRILLFSQFTGMLKLIEEAVGKAGIKYVKLTGRTRDRATPVERFQAGRAPLFLISLKAGGVGLNLTAADTVIHYDPWWNPAVERQATDRAHRIGQDNPVFVYKLIMAGTVEEKIQAMQQRKQALADTLFDPNGGMQAAWSDEDLETLFGPLA
ncbi:MAG: DEAD/DEAH box helicase [Candidatus Thiodiazotropha sp. (ex Epidulcina cf. delphinae)]|nr:DEAD/DEAH box helicase [Candidatus Thiodiazotropha sp. (ex Epidulcina cf. delphinae)]